MYKYGVIDAFKLKIIMAVLMLMDHLYYFLPGFPEWFHIVSRVVAPMFTYLVAEGMYYTSNKVGYIKRMYLFGSIMLAMDIVFILVFGSAPPNSIIMSLAITASIIFCIDKVVKKGEGEPTLDTPSKVKWILLAFFLFVVCLFFEGAMVCPVTGLVFYYLRWNRSVMCGAYIVASLAILWLFRLLGDTQTYMLTAVVPIMLYNGQRGRKGAFPKYFFYIFYPAHIWILFTVKQLFF